MSYGHMPLFFATAAAAQAYLDGCAAGKNFTAENYQDRVNAQRCLRHAAEWTPTPIARDAVTGFPIATTPLSKIPAKRRAS